MSPKRSAMLPAAYGFGLVELMVAMVVGMLAVAAITAVFWSSEGQKRTVTTGADASENGLIALATMERDLRMAGLGLVGLGCAMISGFNASHGAAFSFEPLPAAITHDSPASGTDRLSLAYSASAFANIPTYLALPMLAPDGEVNVVNADGFVRGEVVLISEPSKPCMLLQASDNPVHEGAYWTIPHAAGADFPFNNPPPASFPPAGYSTAAMITNMGAMVRREYLVQGGQLMMRELDRPDSASPPVNPVPVADGVVSIRARYGRDTNDDGYIDVYDLTVPAKAADLVAVQVAVVARSMQLEKTAVSPATLQLWNGGTLANGGAVALDADAQRYRYRVYQTTVPLRNVIWANDP
jgi:type IV pilus assembly protein PilW